MSMSRPLIFLDTETTGLHWKRQIWDIAWIRRDVDGVEFESQHFMAVDLADAELAALEIGRYWERHPRPLGGSGSGRITSTWNVASEISAAFRGAFIVGANPAFDVATIARLLRRCGLVPTWHHRLIDVQAQTMGALGWSEPRGLDACAAELGIDVPDEDRHTAMGDARLARAVYMVNTMFLADGSSR